MSLYGELKPGYDPRDANLGKPWGQDVVEPGWLSQMYKTVLEIDRIAHHQARNVLPMVDGKYRPTRYIAASSKMMDQLCDPLLAIMRKHMPMGPVMLTEDGKPPRMYDPPTFHVEPKPL